LKGKPANPSTGKYITKHKIEKGRGISDRGRLGRASFFQDRSGRRDANEKPSRRKTGVSSSRTIR